MSLKLNGDGCGVLLEELPDGRITLTVQVVYSLRAQQS